MNTRLCTSVLHLLLILLTVSFVAACRGGKTERAYPIATGGDPQRGVTLIRQYSCGACHIIPGVREAEGLLAPPLTFFARRSFIAGEAPNTLENLIQWIVSPQSIEPGTVMPALGLDPQQARDIAAYPYTLR